MKISNVKKLMLETDFSPEKLAKRLGISNMTVRRWMEKPQDEDIPEIYVKALRDVIYQLVLEDVLAPESDSFRAALKKNQGLSFWAILKSLGFSDDLMASHNFSPDRLMVGLSQIGSQENRQKEVNKNEDKINTFARLGEDWKRKINTLHRALASRDLAEVDKLIAYGAFYYLLSPFELIPDGVPVFGLMDDYCVVALAAAYYEKKFGTID